MNISCQRSILVESRSTKSRIRNPFYLDLLRAEIQFENISNFIVKNTSNSKSKHFIHEKHKKTKNLFRKQEVISNRRYSQSDNGIGNGQPLHQPLDPRTAGLVYIKTEQANNNKRKYQKQKALFQCMANPGPKDRVVPQAYHIKTQ